MRACLLIDIQFQNQIVIALGGGRRPDFVTAPISHDILTDLGLTCHASQTALIPWRKRYNSTLFIAL
jgi:hypothetical protein